MYDPLDPLDREIELGDASTNRPPRRPRLPLGLGGTLIIAVLVGTAYLLFSNTAPSANEIAAATPTLERFPTPDITPTPIPFEYRAILPTPQFETPYAAFGLTLTSETRRSGGSITTLAWSPDGTRYVVGDYHGFAVYDRFETLYARHDTPAPVAALAYTPPGDSLYIALSTGELYLYDPANDTLAPFIPPNPAEPLGPPQPPPNDALPHLLALSPDARWLAYTSGAETIFLYDLSGEAQSVALPSPTRPGVASPQPIRALWFHPTDNTLVSFEMPNTGCQWPLPLTETTEPVCQRFPTFTEAVLLSNSAMQQITAYDNGQQLALVSPTGQVFLGPWQAYAGAIDPNILTILQPCPGCYAFDLAVSPDGQTLALATARGLFIVDILTGDLHLQTDESAQRVAFSPDGETLLAITSFGLFDHYTRVATGIVGQPGVTWTLSRRSDRYWGPIYTLALAPPTDNPTGGQLAVGHQSGTINLWRLLDPAPLRELTLYATGAIVDLDYSADAYRIYAVTHFTTGWQQPFRDTLPLETTRQRLEIFPGSALVPGPGPAEVLYVGNRGVSYLTIDDVLGDQPYFTVDATLRNPTRLPQTADLLVQLDAVTLARLRLNPSADDPFDLIGSYGVPTAYAPYVIDPTGSWLIQRSPEVTYRLDLTTGEITHAIESPPGGLLALSDDGRILALALDHGGLWLLDPETFTEIAILPVARADLNAILITHQAEDSYRLFAGGRDGVLYDLTFTLTPRPSR